MSPGGLLCLTLGLTCGAALVQRVGDRRRRKVLRRLATDWRMNFNSADQLQLAARIAHYLPTPGAANVTVQDVIYGIDGDFYRYVFTAQYTVGVLGTKKRHVRVAAFSEPRDRNQLHSHHALVLAPADLNLRDQYKNFTPETIHV